MTELPELTQDWQIDSWRAQTELCAPGPRRKEQWPCKGLTQTCLRVSRGLQWRCGSVLACHRAGSTECSSACVGSFEGGHHYLHHLHHSLKVKSLSHVRLFATPWTVGYQAPPSMGFSRQEYWSGLPFPSPGDLPNTGIESGSPTLSHQGSHSTIVCP